MKRVCVVGLGYIGLPTALMFTKAGYKVHGVDVKKDVVESLSRGIIHIEEPGLADLLGEVIATGNFSCGLKPVKADIFIICVPTPINEERRANLDYVIGAANSIVPYLEKGALVILESTVPPKTCTDVVKPILEKSGLEVGEDIYLAFCPERVLPGKILKEIVENDRIVGGLDETATKLAKEAYSSFVKGKILETNATTAEMVKLMENTYRDVNIALANEFALVAETLGINVWEAIELANHHPRVHIHLPGPGVGGHCIPVVPWFIIEKDEEHTQLIRLSRQLNDSMPAKMVNILSSMVDLNDETIITIWGVAFKPNTDDSSFSPATTLIELLEKRGVQVKAHDPHVKQYEHPLVSLEESTAGSDCIIIITNHDYYKDVDVSKINNMRNKNIIDTRYSIKAEDWKAHGFNVVQFGILSNRPL